MSILEVLCAIVLPLGWIVSCAVAFAKLESYTLPGVQEPQGMFWFFETLDSSRYQPEGRRWIRMLLALQVLPLAAMVAWWLSS